MTLYKRLTLLVTIFFILMSGIILWFVICSNRTLIVNQIYSNAKNSASFLGLTLSKTTDIHDIPTIEGMVASLMATGFYESIQVNDVNGKELLNNVSSTRIYDTPAWFDKVIAIDIPKTSAQIMKGWMNVGNVVIKVDKGYAYNKIYKNFLVILEVLLFSTIVLLSLIYIFLNRVLLPLKKLDKQAEAVDKNEFIIVKDLPKTREFKSVTIAMNKIIARLEKIFHDEVKTLKKYNDLYYKNSDHGMWNKNYFSLKLQSFLNNSDGLVAFVGVNYEFKLKKIIGFKAYKDFKTYISSIIDENFSTCKDYFYAILDDGIIAIVLPDQHYGSTQKTFLQLQQKIQEYEKNTELDDLFDIKIGIGVASYRQGESLKDILSKADQSFVYALNSPSLCYFAQKSVLLSKESWIELIEWSLTHKKISFASQNILNLSSKEMVFKEFYVRLSDKEGNIYHSKDVIPFIASMGMMTKVEKELIEEIIGSYKKDNISSIIINLSTDFIKERKNIDWLLENIQVLNKKGVKICLEFQEQEILNHFEEYKYFCRFIDNKNNFISIQDFVFEGGDLAYLKILNPLYIKVSKMYILNNEAINSVLQNIVSTLGIYIIVNYVETKEEYEKLQSMGIILMQGTYIDEVEKEDE